MKLHIKPATVQERLYNFSQPHQIAMQTGFIGYLRGDFGSGKEFWTSWTDGNTSLKSDVFKAQFDDLVNTLRNIEVLTSLHKMTDYCCNHSDARYEGAYCNEFAYRINVSEDVEGADFVYLLRCIPTRGDYNFYIHVYRRSWFDNHLEKAAKGIRFIDPEYNELFRIPDNDKIEIFYPNGNRSEHRCRYIDECHVQIGELLYHICEFAEKMRGLSAAYRHFKEEDGDS